MKWFLISLTLITHGSFAQTIQGKVLDHESMEPIPSVTIYFNQSYLGVTTDLNGDFKLDISKHKGEPIIISHIGYQTITLEEYSEDEIYKVLLEPVVLETLDFEDDDGISREDKMSRFKREFIGTSYNAKNCEILNPEVIRLVYFPEKNELLAFAKEPILIENRALGYHITYYLKSFNYGRKGTSYLGNFFFKELSEYTDSGTLRRRKRTYQYSTSKIIKGLYNQNLQFYATSGRNEIISNNKNEAYLLGPDTIQVDIKRFTTKLILEKDSVYIQNNGYFDPTGIIWTGHSYLQRIGDLLPYEYKVEED